MRGTVNRRLVGAASGALVVLAGLASSGCTGGPDDNVTAPTFAPAPSEQEPSATPSAEPSASEPDPTGQAPVPPELPQAATQQTPEGAAAFARWWFDTLNYATATGDTETLVAAFQPECVTCTGFTNRITEAYSAGGLIDGGLLTVEVEPAPLVQDGVSTMVVRAVAGSGLVIDASGETTTVLNAETVNLVIAVSWTGDRWIVGDLVS